MLKKFATTFAILCAFAAPAFANTPVQVFGTSSDGIQRVIGAVANSSGLYSLSVSTSGAAGALDVWSKGATIGNSQVTASNVSGVLLASSTTRRGVTFVNQSTTIGAYIGTGTVTTANGVLLNPGATATFTMSAGAAWAVITASSTAVIGILTESN